MVAVAKPVRKYRLIKGSAPHFEPNPDFDKSLPESEDNLRDFEIKPGEVVESSRDLEKIFVGKFTRVSKDDENEIEESEPKNKKRSKPSKTNVDLGKDVTDLFDGAEEADLRIFKSGKLYSVYDGDDLSAPLEDAEDLDKVELKKRLKKLCQ